MRKGKNRIYSDEDKEWLEFILHMKSTGMALVDIKKYSLMRKEDEHGEKPAQELMEILVKHRDEVAAQLKIAIYHDGVNSNR
ncbi:MerR family DNA-binding protein [Peribacillus simplex]|uniref:MerR family DNA-binding protein n=1 Tax=Peribacillus simplex TaxID=1478 RepID=UPI0033388D0A